MKNVQILGTVSLLLFVAATVIAITTKALRPTGPTEQTQTAGNAQFVRHMSEVQDGLVAYYFHSETRCPTCRTIESFAHEAIEAGFAQDLAAGTMQWRVVNYEQRENAEAVDRYQLVAPIVILSKIRGGTEVAWVSLDQVWKLTHDKAEFVKYVQEEVKKLQDKTVS